MSANRFVLETASIDLEDGLVYTTAGSQTLTPSEARIVRLLAARSGSAVTRTEIAGVLGGDAGRAKSRAIDVVVSRLRRKLGDDGRRPHVLVTEHGVGYRLEPAASRSRLQSLTSFGGREAEVGWIREGVETARAVMVSGPTGAGKTRLVAQALKPYPGVAWADGAFQTRAEGTLTIANALGCRARTETEATEAIRRLDANASHIVVLDGTGLRDGVTRSAIERALVVTSRLHIVAIGSCDLEITGARSVWVGSMREDEAVALLVSRARAVAPGFGSGPEDAAAASAIVRLLDGLPGAIEAVVYLARTMSAGELLTELRRVDSPLRTAPASVHLLHARLGPELQRALLKLCCFRGDFSLRDAAMVIAEEAGETVGNLAAFGLLARVEDRGTTWFRVYQASRAVASEGSDGYALLATCRLRSTDVLTGPAAMDVPRNYLASLVRWRTDLEWLHEVALQRGLMLDAARAALTLDPLSSAFGVDLDGHVSRLDAVRGRVGDPLVEAALARSLAWTQRLLGRHGPALRDARAAVTSLVDHPESFQLARCKMTLAAILADGGAVDEACALARDAAGRCETEGWRQLRAVALNTLGVAEDVRGDAAASRDAFTAALGAAEQVRDTERMAASLVNLSSVLTRLGAFDEAAECCRRSEEVDPEGAPLRAAAWNVCLGNLALARDSATEALQRYRRAVAIHAQTGQARGEVTAETNAAWALLDLARYGDATAAFGRAASLSRELGGGLQLARALFGLAVAHAGDRRTLAARSVLNEARGLARSTGANRAIAMGDALAWWLTEPEERFPDDLARVSGSTTDDDVAQVVAVLEGRAILPLTSVHARVIRAIDVAP